MLSYVNVSEFRFSSLYLQMDRERMAGVKQLGREGGWRLKHSILWSHMYCQLHLASLQVSLYLYHVKVIYFTVPKVPLCCFGRQYGNISKIFFEIGKKKLTVISQQQCNKSNREQKKFSRSTVSGWNTWQANTQPQEDSWISSPGSLLWPSLHLQHKNTKYRQQMNLDLSVSLDRLCAAATGLTLVGTMLI